MRYTLQLGGTPSRDYRRRFEIAAETCQRLLAVMGFEVKPNDEGDAYLVTKDGQQYGGAWRQEIAMHIAMRAIERGEVS